jgi:hypothetical protein
MGVLPSSIEPWDRLDDPGEGVLKGKSRLRGLMVSLVLLLRRRRVAAAVAAMRLSW